MLDNILLALQYTVGIILGLVISPFAILITLIWVVLLALLLGTLVIKTFELHYAVKMYMEKRGENK